MIIIAVYSTMMMAMIETTEANYQLETLFLICLCSEQWRCMHRRVQLPHRRLATLITLCRCCRWCFWNHKVDWSTTRSRLLPRRVQRVQRQRLPWSWSSLRKSRLGNFNCHRNARTGASVHVKIVETRFAHVDITASMCRCNSRLRAWAPVRAPCRAAPARGRVRVSCRPGRGAY